MIFDKTKAYFLARKTAVAAFAAYALIGFYYAVFGGVGDGLALVIILIFFLPPTILIILKQRWAVFIMTAEFMYISGLSLYDIVHQIDLTSILMAIISWIPLWFLIKSLRLPYRN